MATTPRTDDSPEILFHLRWVAKIALWVGAVAAGALVIMPHVLTDDAGWSYREPIRT